MSAQVRLVIVAVLLSACYCMEVKGNVDRAIAATGPLPSPPKTQSPMPPTRRRESSPSLSWDSYPTKNPDALYLVPVILLAVVVACAVYHICYRPHGFVKRLMLWWHKPPRSLRECLEQEPPRSTMVPGEGTTVSATVGVTPSHAPCSSPNMDADTPLCCFQNLPQSMPTSTQGSPVKPRFERHPEQDEFGCSVQLLQTCTDDLLFNEPAVVEDSLPNTPSQGSKHPAPAGERRSSPVPFTFFSY